MSKRARAFVIAALAFAGACGAFGAPAASADTPPSRWDRAKDPDVAGDYYRHIQARAWLGSIHEARRQGRPDTADGLARMAVDALERRGAAASGDVRLRFDLGELYLVMANHQRSADVLRAALAQAPNHPAAEEAWLDLAFACGHLGDHACEKKAYIEVLRRVSEDVQRATPTLNLAETEMHLGDLKEAIEGYREALRIAGRIHRRDTAPLAVWGLAVALDRSGDRAAAEKEARFAQDLESSMLGRGTMSILHSDAVFFVPAYELHYYDGLGAFARGKVAKTATEAARHFAKAESSFGQYVQAADASDRWLEMAKARLAASKVERERAEARAAREPPKKFVDDSDVPL
jgi:tetratricopeptide (TPR) repeat protein